MRWTKARQKQSQNQDKGSAHRNCQSWPRASKKRRGYERSLLLLGFSWNKCSLASGHTTEVHIIETSVSSVHLESACPWRHSRTIVMGHGQLICVGLPLFFNMWKATDPQTLHPCSFPSAKEFSMPIPAMTEVISTGFPPGIKIQLHCHPAALQQPASNELLIPLESLRRK